MKSNQTGHTPFPARAGQPFLTSARTVRAPTLARAGPLATCGASPSSCVRGATPGTHGARPRFLGARRGACPQVPARAGSALPTGARGASPAPSCARGATRAPTSCSRGASRHARRKPPVPERAGLALPAASAGRVRPLFLRARGQPSPGSARREPPLSCGAARDRSSCARVGPALDPCARGARPLPCAHAARASPFPARAAPLEYPGSCARGPVLCPARAE